MTVSAPDEFDKMIAEEFRPESREVLDHNPYGNPTTKPGLTRRGKAALGVGAAVIASGVLVGYQVHASNEVKAQEVELKAQALELEKLRELNRASEVQRAAAANQDKVRQTSVDTCVKARTDADSNRFSSSYRMVVDDCQAQYGSAGGDDMASAASATTARTSGGGDVNQGLLIGVGALGLIVAVAARKATKSNPA